MNNPAPATDWRVWDQPDSLWNQIAERSREVDKFSNRTEWQLSFLEEKAPDQNLLIKTDGDNLLTFSQHRLRPGQFMVVPVESSWQFGCPLLGADPVAYFREMDVRWRAQAKAAGQVHGYVISGLRPRGKKLKQLRQQMVDRYDIKPDFKTIICSASLSGGLDGFLSRRSSSLRRSLRKQARRAANKGIRFERHSPATTQEADSIYQRMLEVELRSWKGIGRCGMAEGSVRNYYAVMLRRLAAGSNARVIFARHEEQDIGFIFGGCGRNYYRGQQFSFDHNWQSASIGNLMQLEQVRWLCEEGAIRYDMGPMMGYKSRWTETRVPMVSCALLPR